MGSVLYTHSIQCHDHNYYGQQCVVPYATDDGGLYCTGIPLFFVVIGLAARADYYGVRGDDGDLAL